LALLLAVALIYSNAVRLTFALDDRAVVADNPSIHQLWPPGPILNPPSTGSPVQARPLANLTFAISYALGGQRPAGYHLFNILLHGLNVCLLFALTARTLKFPRIPLALIARAGAIAFLAALLWAVHPLASAAVDYVSQRTELLASSFYLLILYGIARASTAASPRRRLLWQLAAGLAAILGVASKETVATAPLLAILFDRLFVDAGPWRPWLRSRRPLLAGFAAAWALLAILVIAAGGNRAGTAGFGAGVSPWLYLCTQFKALCLYAKLTFWPHPLIFDYGPGVVRGWGAVWPYALLVCLALVATAFAFRRWPRAAFLAVAWFLILSPTSSVIPVRTQTIAEHRAYLPLAVALVGVVCTCSLLVPTASDRWLGHNALALPLIAIAVVCAVLTMRRNRTYRDELTLWEDTLAKCPTNPRAYSNVAVKKFIPLGDSRSEMDYYARALELDPEYFDVLVNRAGAYSLMGDGSSALADAEHAIRIKPAEAAGYLARGRAWISLNAPNRTIADCDRALRLMPSLAEAYALRGGAYRVLGQHALAVADLTTAITMAPGRPHYYFHRALAEMDLNQPAAAEHDLDKVLQLGPVNADAVNSRGIVRATLGRHADAVADFTRAAELRPQWYVPYVNRASSRTMLGDYDGAWADVRAAQQRGGSPSESFLESLRRLSGREPTTQP
jgi:tetratricopeptide (TPR) repeat protein